MQLSKLILAVLPALAAAQEYGTTSSAPAGASTTTLTSTTKMTKTITISHAPTSVSAPYYGSNSTATYTGGSTGIAPTSTATSPPSNGGVSLEAGKVVLAGVAGMVAIAFL